MGVLWLGELDNRVVMQSRVLWCVTCHYFEGRRCLTRDTDLFVRCTPRDDDKPQWGSQRDLGVTQNRTDALRWSHDGATCWTNDRRARGVISHRLTRCLPNAHRLILFANVAVFASAINS